MAFVFMPAPIRPPRFDPGPQGNHYPRTHMGYRVRVGVRVRVRVGVRIRVRVRVKARMG